MNRFHNDCILSEKTMNTYPNADKSTPAKSATTTIKRAPLTKAYSCSDATPSNCTDHCTFITPREFVELLSQNSNAQDLSSVPILDCRSQMDFGCERIRSSHNINCRAKIMARKLTSKRLEDVEPNLSSSLSNSDDVILYDQSTNVKGEDKINTLPINLVIQAAQKSNKKVHIIQGGLDAVKTEYPYLIESPTEALNNTCEQDLIPPPPATPGTVDKENFVMTEILPHVFVGNICDAQDRDRLNQNGITHIINCTPDLPLYWENKYEYMRVDILDSPSQNILKYFDSVIEFIDNTLRSNNHNILVHCSAGISRSPTLVIAYMMKKYSITLDEAFEKMRKLRQIVDPNVNFIIQLREWEKKIMAASMDLNEDNSNSGTNNSASSRTTSSTYCGSTSKNKTDAKTKHTDSSIIVN